MSSAKETVIRLTEQSPRAATPVANENAAGGAEFSFGRGEDHFERLAMLAADIFDMPIATFAVAEGGGLCLKGACGIDAQVLPPLTDLITRVMRNNEMVLAPLAGEAGSTAELGFFAGLALHDSCGRPLGAVALADRRSRRFGERERQRLQRLAAIAEQELWRPAASPNPIANAGESASESLGELSGLTHFRSQLRAAAGRSDRDGGLAAVLLVGLDRFELMYNVVSRDDSDTAYRLVADRLLAGSGPGTTITRLGVDQFVVLIPAARDLNQVIGAAQRILAGFALPLEAEGRETHLNASIGISVYPFDGADAETLLRQSSAALFRSQREGGDRYHFCTPDMKRAADERFELELALRKAVERGELELVYQPKVSLKDSRIAGMEALARWSHEGLGSVPPEKFIPLAERAHCIGPIGDWVLRTACRQARAWLDAGLTVVAEGVETPQQLARLKQYNCDEVQGFLYSEPLPAADMEALLQRIAKGRTK